MLMPQYADRLIGRLNSRVLSLPHNPPSHVIQNRPFVSGRGWMELCFENVTALESSETKTTTTRIATKGCRPYWVTSIYLEVATLN